VPTEARRNAGYTSAVSQDAGRAEPTRSARRLLPTALALSVLLLTISVAVLVLSRNDHDATGTPSLPLHRPNLILIVTDDQRWDTMWAMPRVMELIGGHGVTFTNAFVTTPYCCPSRATILTGLYSRHTGVLSNLPPDGGATVFDDQSTVATWLQGAGYETALIGKYLNAYSSLGTYVPPGWDHWAAVATKAKGVHYYKHTMNEDGRLVPYGRDPQDYATTVMSDLASRFVRTASPPFFLYYAPDAPHAPAVPAAEDRDAFASLKPFAAESFNEPDVLDKPWGDDVPPLTPGTIDELSNLRRRMLQSLQAVDRSIASLVQELSGRGQLQNTVIVFMSDNGYLWGEHRLRRKLWPYEETIRVPLMVRIPNAEKARTERRLALNIDIAPTLADLAGITPTLDPDGRSLVPFLAGVPPPQPWRTSFLIEYLGHEYFPPGPSRYEAIRTERYKYVVYWNGWRELYDLSADPSEMSNLAGLPAHASLEARLSHELTMLKRGLSPGR
jgi:N-acetylglucosamine-6-sulfatase